MLYQHTGAQHVYVNYVHLEAMYEVRTYTDKAIRFLFSFSSPAGMISESFEAKNKTKSAHPRFEPLSHGRYRN